MIQGNKISCIKIKKMIWLIWLWYESNVGLSDDKKQRI